MKMTPEHRAAISRALLGKPKGKPAWNKGLTMTAEQRRNSGRQPGSVPWNRGMETGHAPWSGKKRGPQSPEWRAKIAAANRKPKSPEHAAKILAARWHGPRPEYKGIRFRSSYEVRFARVLDTKGIAWEYEPRRFNLGTCSYLPDFYLPGLGIYIEVKGYFSEESQQKVARFQGLHPELPLMVVRRTTLERLEA